MNKTTIEKILNMIDNNKLDDAKQLLKIEMLKSDKTKNIKLIDAIKKYLKHSEKMNGDGRPILTTIMNKNGVQFVCNGVSMYVFNEYIKDFEILKNTYDDIDGVIDYSAICKQYVKYENLNDFDYKILTNIKKIVTFLKNNENLNNKDLFIIPFANKFYDAKMLLELSEIINNDFSDLQIYYSEKNIDAIQVKNKLITGVLLPCRCLKQDEADLYNNRLNKFFAMVED